MRTNAPEMLGNVFEAVYEGLTPTAKNMLLMKRLIRDYISHQLYFSLSWGKLSGTMKMNTAGGYAPDCER